MSSEATRSTPPEIIEEERAAYLKELPDPDPNWPPDVRGVYIEICSRLFEPGLTAQSVVNECGFQAHDVYSRFSYHTGTDGIKDFLIHHLLRLAKRLLQFESLSVSRVALAVGYVSPSGFSATFKRQIGQSPTAFREQECD